MSTLINSFNISFIIFSHRWFVFFKIPHDLNKQKIKIIQEDVNLLLCILQLFADQSSLANLIKVFGSWNLEKLKPTIMGILYGCSIVELKNFRLKKIKLFSKFKVNIHIHMCAYDQLLFFYFSMIKKIHVNTILLQDLLE